MNTDYSDELLVTLCEDCHENERLERSGDESDLIEMLRRLFFSERYICTCGRFPQDGTTAYPWSSSHDY